MSHREIGVILLEAMQNEETGGILILTGTLLVLLWGLSACKMEVSILTV